MLYSSTRGTDNDKNFIEVMLNGLANDGGLYVPNKFHILVKKKSKILNQKNIMKLLMR